MTFKEASHQFKIPIDDLKAMRSEGLLSEPLPPQEINNLSFLRYFWGRSEWLKRQLRRMNKKSRLALVRTAEYSKVEAYVFSRYYNAREEERFTVNQIASEVNKYYKTPITKKLIHRIYKMRRKAENARYYDRKKRS